MSEKFTVIFYDEDGKTVLDKQEIEQGKSVKYQGKTPEKPAENGVEYTFSHWETTGNVECVEENLEIFAKYEESSKMALQEDALWELSEENAEKANLNEVMKAGQKVNDLEKATRELNLEQKKDLVKEVKEKGSVNLDKEVESERE